MTERPERNGMTSILSGLDTVRQALAAQQFALAIAQRNVANVNDPNYTRQQAVFHPVGQESLYGIAGVSIQAARDRYLDYSVSRELQSLGENTVAYRALQQVDGILGSSGADGLRAALSNFFNSFSALSSAPEDAVLRQQVLSRANELAGEFRRIYTAVQQVQTAADGSTAHTVDAINSITAQIAVLNERIAAARQEHSGSESMLCDSRRQLLETLSGLVDISYFETESGAMTVATRQGGLLVLEGGNRELSLTRTEGEEFLRVQLGGRDITDLVESGELGALIRLRDHTLAGTLSALDTMAVAIASRVNEQHALGCDLDGEPGEDLFVPFVEVVPGSVKGAARAMRVSITDASRIAAAAAGTGVGDNSNARLLAAIAEEKLFVDATQTSIEFYGALLYRIGSDESAAGENMETQAALIEQLRNQRSALSGVNIDEEAVNIIQYQKAYQASSRLAGVLDALSSEILDLLGS